MSNLMAVALGVPGVALPAAEQPHADFSDTPMWLTFVKALIVFVYLLLSVLVVIWFERRVVGRIQQRPGPNRFGPFGLLQTLADGVKLMTKEDPRPANADKVVFTLASLIAGTMCFVSFAVIPLAGQVNLFGHNTPLQVTDASSAVLLTLAIASIGAYGILLAGWSSGSTYPLYGALRSSAQIISYEIAMGLALVAVFIHAGSMSTSTIVYQQRDVWYVIPAFFSFVIYVITMVGETNRWPFANAEGEGEIVGGFHTEYGSMRFGMYYLGEYINMFTVSAMCSTLFLGGWQAPPGIAAINDGMFNHGWWGLLWFTLKMWLFLWFFVWLRGTLPNIRYDQFMRFGWKFLIPATIAWVLVVAFIRGAQLGYLGDNTFSVGGREFPVAMLFVIGLVTLLALAIAWVWDNRNEAKAEANRIEHPAEIDPFAGGHPVPPMPGQRLVEPARAAGRGVAARPEPVVTTTRQETKEGPRG
ncbi:NADH-quinone oxidoreductase subunit NuoH [Actinomycetota bacterium]